MPPQAGRVQERRGSRVHEEQRASPHLYGRALVSYLDQIEDLEAPPRCLLEQIQRGSD